MATTLDEYYQLLQQQEEENRLLGLTPDAPTAATSWDGLQVPQPTRESGYAIPEFPTEAASLQGEALRYRNPIGETPPSTENPGDAWRDTLNVYERQPSGAILVRQIKDLPQAQKQLSTPEVIPNSVFQSIQNLSRIEDDEARQDAFFALQRQVEGERTRIMEQTAQRNEEALGIPRLREAIARSEEVDRQNSNPLLGLANSPLTQSLYKQLDDQQQRARLLTEEQLGRNVTLIGLQTSMAAAGKTLEKMATRSARRQDMQDQKVFQLELQSEAEKQQALLQTSPTVMRRAAMLDPAIATMAPEDAAIYIQRRYRSAQERALLDTDPEAYLPMAVRGGNAQAERIFIAEEAERTGQSPELIRTELKQIRALAQDPKKFDSIVLGTLPKDARDAFRSAGRMAVTQQDKAALEERRYDLALAAHARLKQAEFASNVAAWAGDDPELAGAVAAVSSTSGKADIASVMDAYVGSLQGQARVAKENEFYAKVEQQIARRNTSMLGAIDARAVIGKLQLHRSESTAKAISEVLATVLNPGRLAQSPVPEVSSFFSGR